MGYKDEHIKKYLPYHCLGLIGFSFLQIDFVSIGCIKMNYCGKLRTEMSIFLFNKKASRKKFIIINIR